MNLVFDRQDEKARVRKTETVLHKLMASVVDGCNDKFEKGSAPTSSAN